MRRDLAAVTHTLEQRHEISGILGDYNSGYEDGRGWGRGMIYELPDGSGDSEVDYQDANTLSEYVSGEGEFTI